MEVLTIVKQKEAISINFIHCDYNDQDWRTPKWLPQLENIANVFTLCGVGLSEKSVLLPLDWYWCMGT